MTIILERLVFLTPSISHLLLHKHIEYLCVSKVRSVRTYVDCCYISMENLLIEILEVTNLSQAQNFAFYNQAKNLSKTEIVAFGLKTNDLVSAQEALNKSGVNTTEFYTSVGSNYPKGYKHKSAEIDLQWFGKQLYITEYDNLFLEERKLAITRELEKLKTFSVAESALLFQNQLPPHFIDIKDSVPSLHVRLSTTHKNLWGLESLRFDWLSLQFDKT